MDFDGFQEFMLQSAAKHEADIAAIRESLKSMANTVDRLVDNQVFLQESLDLLTNQTRAQAETQQKDHTEMRDSQRELRESLHELERIVFRHVTDPGAHGSNVQ